jgi:hypothetical protein
MEIEYMSRQSGSGDLSLRTSSLFYLLLVLPFWFWMMVAIFSDNSIKPPVFDPETGELLSSRKEFEAYILFGERKKSDFPFGARIALAAYLTGFLVFWGVRIHIELMIIRRAGRTIRGFIYKD